jgi:hypothetical protein
MALPSPFISQIDATFPKGMAFSQWLQSVHGSSMPGTISITNARYSVKTTYPPTQQWIYTANNPLDPGNPAVQYFTMNTPVEKVIGNPDAACGRVVFTDLHLLPAEPGKTADVGPFPSACDASQPLSPQELALEFMMFDLSSCLIDEKKGPSVPEIVR